jgi:Taurine catabolism dioxygenase TauD, TfdA family
MDGIFEEQASDAHVGLRNRVLGYRSATTNPAGPTMPCRCRIDNFSDEFTRKFKYELRERGLVSIALNEPLPTPQFADFAGQLGAAVPERDPVTAPFVENDIVLNLITRYRATDDVSLQPFSTGFLTLHSESSGRSVSDQPRYIVLMCCEPGDASVAARTMLVSMRDVEAALEPEILLTLSSTRYRGSPDAPTIVRRDHSRYVFSFRDFWRQPLEWSHWGHATEAATVNYAIRGLLTGLYGAPIQAIDWTRGLMVIIDNQRYFHGKSEARGVSSRPRHLKRLRIR